MCANHRIPLPVRAGKPTRPSPLDDPALLARAVAGSDNTREAVRFLGLASCGTTNRRFEQRCVAENIELPWKSRRPGTVRQLNALPANVINAALAANETNAAALEQLGIRKDGNAYAWLRRYRLAMEAT